MELQFPGEGAGATGGRDDFAARLETEGLALLPDRPFTLTPKEAVLLSPAFSDGRAKNISLGAAQNVRGLGGGPSGADGAFRRLGGGARQ